MSDGSYYKNTHTIGGKYTCLPVEYVNEEGTVTTTDADEIDDECTGICLCPDNEQCDGNNPDMTCIDTHIICTKSDNNKLTSECMCNFPTQYKTCSVGQFCTSAGACQDIPVTACTNTEGYVSYSGAANTACNCFGNVCEPNQYCISDGDGSGSVQTSGQASCTAGLNPNTCSCNNVKCTLGYCLDNVCQENLCSNTDGLTQITSANGCRCGNDHCNQDKYCFIEDGEGYCLEESICDDLTGLLLSTNIDCVCGVGGEVCDATNPVCMPSRECTDAVLCPNNKGLFTNDALCQCGLDKNDLQVCDADRTCDATLPNGERCGKYAPCKDGATRCLYGTALDKQCGIDDISFTSSYPSFQNKVTRELDLRVDNCSDVVVDGTMTFAVSVRADGMAITMERNDDEGGWGWNGQVAAQCSRGTRIYHSASQGEGTCDFTTCPVDAPATETCKCGTTDNCGVGEYCESLTVLDTSTTPAIHKCTALPKCETDNTELTSTCTCAWKNGQAVECTAGQYCTTTGVCATERPVNCAITDGSAPNNGFCQCLEVVFTTYSPTDTSMVSSSGSDSSGNYPVGALDESNTWICVNSDCDYWDPTPVFPAIEDTRTYGGSACTPSNPCGACAGDCDNDNQCQTGLKCEQQSGTPSYDAGPTHAMLAQCGGSRGGSGYGDYCYDPTQLVPTDWIYDRHDDDGTVFAHLERGWYQIELSSQQTVVGTTTQGRHNSQQWVTSWTFKSSTDGSTWTDVDGGATFTGNSDGGSVGAGQVEQTFATPVTAKYIRFYPQASHNSVSARMGVRIEQHSQFVQSAATQCVACPAAKFQTGDDPCAPCDAGKHGNTETVGSTGCTDCPAGRYAHNARDNAQHCTACGTGKSSAQTGQTLETTCDDCLTYQYQDENGTAACKTCPVSETSGTGASNCRPICRCDFGLAATDCTTAAREKCSTCIPEYGLNENDICAPCEANHQNPSGGPTCTPCPAGQGSERGQPCENCPPGKQSDADGLGCYPLCPVGTFADKTTSDDGIDTYVCTKCALGKYSDTHTSACTDCPLGRAQSTTGAVECQLCEEKTFSNETGLHACYVCDDGTGLGQTGLTKAADCRDCAANHVYNSGTDSCEACPGGEQRLYTDAYKLVRMDACETCPAGQTSEQGQACTPCPSGTYSNDARQCIPCLPGTTSAAGSTSADDCIVDTSAQCSYYDDLDCDQLDLEFERDCTQTCSDPAASCSKLRDAFVEKGCGNQRTFPDFVEIGFDNATYIVCQGQEARVTWNGNHNIGEALDATSCVSNGTIVDQYFNTGHEQLFVNDELAAQPGQIRYFKCDAHCGARFKTYCIL